MYAMSVSMWQQSVMFFLSLILGFGLGCVGSSSFCDDREMSQIEAIHDCFAKSSPITIRDAHYMTLCKTVIIMVL
jgi:hypothetical protein